MLNQSTLDRYMPKITISGTLDGSFLVSRDGEHRIALNNLHRLSLKDPQTKEVIEITGYLTINAKDEPILNII